MVDAVIGSPCKTRKPNNCMRFAWTHCIHATNDVLLFARKNKKLITSLMWVNVATVAPHADHWMAESLQQATSLGAPGSHLPAIPLASGGGSRAQKRE